MKLIVLSVIFICFTSIALINLNYYRAKNKVIDELINFFKFYKNEISFNKADFLTIASIYSKNISQNTYLIMQNPLDEKKYPKCLNFVEKKDIKEMFLSLGKHDLEAEINISDNYIYRLSEMGLKLQKESNIKGELRTKLIFVFGLILLIIIM